MITLIESFGIFDDDDEVAVTMGKRKGSLEENARQCRKATPSKRSRKIKFKCSHPYSSKHISFKVEPNKCDNGWKYNLISAKHGEHNISRYNPKKCFVLTHRKYTITLKEWLENTKNENRWRQLCRRVDAYRLKEEPRQIIRGILRAVNELHTDNSIHGFLYHPENFAINDESVIEGGHEKIKRVFLIHAKCELNQDFVAPDSKAIEEGKKNDMCAVLNVIFNQIIENVTRLKHPEDLQDLRELLEKQDVSQQGWKLIVNHPSLWHWKSRFSYVERVQMHYRHAKQSIKNSMKQEFNNIKVGDWINEIRLRNSDTPLCKVLHYSKFKQYSSTPEELLRYLRNLHVHYKDDWGGHRRYLRGEVIDFLATQVSKLFLVDLYKIMCKLNIKI